MTVAHSNELILKVLLCWYKEQIEKPGEMKRVEGEYGVASGRAGRELSRLVVAGLRGSP